MEFKHFYRGLTPAQREALAASVHTTVGYLHQIAYGKQIELGLADALVAVAGGALELSEMPLTDRARAQDAVRRSVGKVAAA